MTTQASNMNLDLAVQNVESLMQVNSGLLVVDLLSLRAVLDALAGYREELRLMHVLFCLAEESAEVIQRTSKAARFGLTEIQKNQPHDNTKRLSLELNDLQGVAELLQEMGVDIELNRRDWVDAKRLKLSGWMRYSELVNGLPKENL